MKHPALIRKLREYRYEKLYSKYTWMIVAAAGVVVFGFLLLVYCIYGDKVPGPVILVIGCAAFLVCIAIGDHFGARIAKREANQVEDSSERDENSRH
ncbi:hypothetical protein [Parahaliea mediterranea]|uniref:Uncharacterized protein n=1 Tax=Parahaliea mediterranea TaxID=651086 RepID=A0A939DE93_9GAMM|nr:hypothetical protein [Parahaliea mediterranea]MBN7795922.1 hypothetical protein [Parahaliea mediterranea]